VLGVQAAALEKAAAGEGRNVEHVALHTEGTDALAAGAQGAKKKQRLRQL
jgi:hypothetical protein